jgi:hypothetical protein
VPVEPHSYPTPERESHRDTALNRRRLLLSATGFVATLAALTAGLRLAGADEKKPPPDSDDDEQTGRDAAGADGIALLQQWMEGDIPSATISDPGWTFAASQVGNYAFYIPEGWSASEETDPTPANYNDGFTTSTRLASPDEDAIFYVYDVALLPGVVTMEQFVTTTLQLLANGEEIELLVDERYTYLAPDDASFVAVRMADLIVTMQTFSSVFVSSSLSTSSYSSTIQLGRTDDFNHLAADYFYPMLSNFERFSGGSGESTPTPTPTS